MLHPYFVSDSLKEKIKTIDSYKLTLFKNTGINKKSKSLHNLRIYDYHDV